MSKNIGHNDFDYVLLNAQLLRRCTRSNLFQLVIFLIALMFVFYCGRQSNKSCDYFHSGVYNQRLESFENFTISEEDGAMNVSTTSPSKIQPDDFIEILR